MTDLTELPSLPVQSTAASGTTSDPDHGSRGLLRTLLRFQPLASLIVFAWHGPRSLDHSLRMEWRFVAIRWLGILVLAPSLPFLGLSSRAHAMALAVIGAAAVYNLIVQLLLLRGSTLFNSGYLTTICDGLLNVGLMSFAGGFDTPLYYIFYTVTVSTAMRYGYGPVLAIALLFVSSDMTQALITQHMVSGTFVVRSAFLLITAVLAGYLHEQAQDAKAALEERLREANALNRELESFSYSVSHDLRAPLRSIDGFSQALLEDYEDRLDAEGKDFLMRVRAASQRMARLIDDLLDLSRVTRSEIRPRMVNLSQLTWNIADGLLQMEPERPVYFDIAGDIVASGDEHLLRVVLENLLGNAWKFTRNQPRAKITFGVEERIGNQWFFVRDNGVGFAMVHADKLFGAFQRLHSDDEFEGTGIGLATVQRIIHRHGGQVDAESREGYGATFYFTLPMG